MIYSYLECTMKYTYSGKYSQKQIKWLQRFSKQDNFITVDIFTSVILVSDFVHLSRGDRDTA